MLRHLLPFALLAGFALGQVPRPAPDITVYLENGSPLKLSQYKGKVVLATFLLTT
jgi:cytochrome oxidase Cu insertion factor (SCO1/SenC/PrrC family)